MTLLIVIVVAILLYVIVAYNGMIKLRNRVKEAWSDIDVQLKRRYNLIPNIVETVKGYAAHEEGVFTKITEARANAINATNIKDQGVAENMLSGALKSLFAVAENYPDLKANENFMQLQNELVDTEDKIQSARRFYNSVVKDFNTKIQQFPAKVIAQAFKFKSEEFFEVEDEEQKELVEVEFSKEGTRQAETPAPATTEEAPDEEKEEEKPEPEPEPEPEVEEEKPAVCPKCGGEMTDDHVCPVVVEEEKPAKKKSKKKKPVKEEKGEDEEAEEAPEPEAEKEEEKPEEAEETPEPESEEEPATEEEKPEEPAPEAEPEAEKEEEKPDEEPEKEEEKPDEEPEKEEEAEEGDEAKEEDNPDQAEMPLEEGEEEKK